MPSEPCRYVAPKFVSVSVRVFKACRTDAAAGTSSTTGGSATGTNSSGNVTNTGTLGGSTTGTNSSGNVTNTGTLGGNTTGTDSAGNVTNSGTLGSGSGSSTTTTGGITQDDYANYEYKTVSCLQGEEAKTKLLFDRLATTEALQCRPSNAIASVPEWWQLRPEAQRSQLVILFAEVYKTGKLGKSRWSLTIPHYNRPKGFKPRIPDYEKGSWEGILVLKDNSKIIVNAKSRSECSKVLNALKINVPVEYRTVNGKAVKAKIGERINTDLKEVRVTAVRADFYSTGAKNMEPDWSINLKRK